MMLAYILLIVSIVLCCFGIVWSYRKYDGVSTGIYYAIGILVIAVLTILISNI